MKKLLLALLMSCNLFATNRYYDSGCSNGSAYNPGVGCTGGSALVYQTFAAAYNAMVAGDTLYMATDLAVSTSPGFTWTKSGTVNSRMTLTSYGTRHKFSKTGSPPGNDKLFYLNGASYITINNVEFDATSFYNKAIYVDGSTGVTITGSYFHHGHGECLRVAGANSGMSITNNTITNCGVNGGFNGEAIYFGDTSASSALETNGTISGNDISAVGGDGIDIRSAARSVIVENNYIHDTTMTGSSATAGIPQFGQELFMS